LRDGAAFLIGDVGACSTSIQAQAAKVYQNGVWYEFYVGGASPHYLIKRIVSGSLLDFNSVTPTTAHDLGTSAASGLHVLRVSDSAWYLFCVVAGDVKVSFSSNLGVSWTTPVGITLGEYFSRPSVIASGVLWYLYVVDGTDRILAYTCPIASDPLVDTNWTVCAANPLYDSPYAALDGQVAIDSSGRVVWVGSMYEATASHIDHLWALECSGPGTKFTRQRIVGTFDYGVATNAIVPGCVLFNPDDGYWYVDAYQAGFTTCTWVSETLGGMMFRVPSVAPAYWPVGAGIGLQFPQGGLSWEEKRDVKVVRNRGAISQLRLADGGLSGSYKFAYDGNAGEVRDMLAVDTKRSIGDVAAPALLLCERDYAGVWSEYHLFPEAVVDLSFGEGDESNELTISFTSPLSRPLIGLLNAGSVGSEMRAPGGATPL
jgi:hypothetical protein